jgi:hypothetical protein
MPRWPAWVLAAGLLAIPGCGGEPAERGMAEADGDGLVIAYEAGNHLHRHGGRVFEDGRYELFSSSDPRAKPDWKAYEPFTPEQVEQIRAEAERAAASGIPDRISAGEPPPPDAATAHFTLPGDREIVVGNWPANAPAELDRVLQRIAELRRRPPVPSTWRVWSGGETVELEAPCEVGEVDVLRGLRDAIFLPAAAPAPEGDREAGDDPPAGTPLVSITFAAPGGEEVLEVFADGRRVDRAGGGEPRATDLDGDRMAAIRRALAATDWRALPARLC